MSKLFRRTSVGWRALSLSMLLVLVFVGCGTPKDAQESGVTSSDGLVTPEIPSAALPAGQESGVTSSDGLITPEITSAALPAGDKSGVASSDGLVNLEIPLGALPAGVELADLSIRPISSKNAAEGDLVYVLGPEGVEFSEPIKLKVSIPSGGGSSDIPLIVLVGDDSVEPISETTITFGRAGEDTVVEAELRHFSRLVIFGNGLFSLDMTEVDGAKYRVGRGPTLKITVAAKEFAIRPGSEDDPSTIGYFVDGWNMHGEMNTFGAVGRRDYDLPHRRYYSFEGGNTYQDEAEIICEESGTARASYGVTLDSPGERG